MPMAGAGEGERIALIALALHSPLRLPESRGACLGSGRARLRRRRRSRWAVRWAVGCASSCCPERLLLRLVLWRVLARLDRRSAVARRRARARGGRRAARISRELPRISRDLPRRRRRAAHWRLAWRSRTWRSWVGKSRFMRARAEPLCVTASGHGVCVWRGGRHVRPMTTPSTRCAAPAAAAGAWAVAGSAAA